MLDHTNNTHNRSHFMLWQLGESRGDSGGQPDSHTEP